MNNKKGSYYLLHKGQLAIFILLLPLFLMVWIAVQIGENLEAVFLIIFISLLIIIPLRYIQKKYLNRKKNHTKTHLNWYFQK
ncbi:MAG: hypothetical protein LAT82_05585 [Nanoarchaeota archaeon]|nr:hypothetical protein [Nanoarchaeota archaeon]